MYVYVPIIREIPTKGGDEFIPNSEPLNRHLEKARLHDICGHQSTASAVSPATVAKPGSRWFHMPRILSPLAPLRHQWLVTFPWLVDRVSRITMARYIHPL